MPIHDNEVICLIQIKQGDAYTLPIHLTMNNETISDDDISCIEVYFGNQRHLYPDGDLTYDKETGIVGLPLKQKDTLSLSAGSGVVVDVRVKFTSGNVQGIVPKLYATIADAVSNEVL